MADTLEKLTERAREHFKGLDCPTPEEIAALAGELLEEAARIPESIAGELCSTGTPANLAVAYGLQNIAKAIRQLAGKG